MSAHPRIWKAVQLFVAFHKDRRGNHRSEPVIWPPKRPVASLSCKPDEQETFAVLSSADPDRSGDVQMRLRPDAVVLSRNSGPGWRGVMAGGEDVLILTDQGTTIAIRADGGIAVERDDEITEIAPDGTITEGFRFDV